MENKNSKNPIKNTLNLLFYAVLFIPKIVNGGKSETISSDWGEKVKQALASFSFLSLWPLKTVGLKSENIARETDQQTDEIGAFIFVVSLIIVAITLLLGLIHLHVIGSHAIMIIAAFSISNLHNLTKSN